MNDSLYWLCVYQLSIDTKERKKDCFRSVCLQFEDNGSQEVIRFPSSYLQLYNTNA